MKGGKSNETQAIIVQAEHVFNTKDIAIRTDNQSVIRTLGSYEFNSRILWEAKLDCYVLAEVVWKLIALD